MCALLPDNTTCQCAQVEEDPSQPECAISGEPFERWYDPDTDKWYYVGAVILTGEEFEKQVFVSEVAEESKMY
jgi:hypothetical protein